MKAAIFCRYMFIIINNNYLFIIWKKNMKEILKQQKTTR